VGFINLIIDELKYNPYVKVVENEFIYLLKFNDVTIFFFTELNGLMNIIYVK